MLCCADSKKSREETISAQPALDETTIDRVYETPQNELTVHYYQCLNIKHNEKVKQ